MTEDTDKLATLENTGRKFKRLGAWLKSHPGAMIALASILGVSGEVTTELLAYDLPGWVVGLLVVGYAAADWGRKVGLGIFELVAQFKEFRRETRERFEEGDSLFEKILALREKDRAEIEAHAEELARIRKHVKLPADKMGYEE